MHVIMYGCIKIILTDSPSSVCSIGYQLLETTRAWLFQTQQSSELDTSGPGLAGLNEPMGDSTAYGCTGYNPLSTG